MAVDRTERGTPAEQALTLGQISRGCGVTAEHVLLLVAEGVLCPRGRHQHEWVFDADDLARARRALRIQHDLGVNSAGAALAVELIDEMQRLRRRIDVLESLAFRR